MTLSSTLELVIHRKGTTRFIAADPTQITLLHRTEEIIDGTKRFNDAVARMPQTFKVIWQGDNGVVREGTPDGGVRRFDFVLVGEYDATVAINDFWKVGEQTFVIRYVYPDNGYEVKAGGVSHGASPTPA